MRTNEFNTKYFSYLEDGHYGLDIYNEDFTNWLDEKFQEFIKKPNFKYSQIKEKFWRGRFYCEGLTREEIREVEEKIDELNKLLS